MKDIRFWHRIQLPDGSYTPGEVVHGPDGGHWPTTRFAMPNNLKDKRVLDIGAWDGFFSFEAEKRGAKEVIAADTTIEQGGNWGGTKGFEYCKKSLNSKVEYKHLNIEDYTESYGQFDLVLCYGVLYHLKSPLIAIKNLSKLTKDGGQCLLETAINNNHEGPILEYRPGHDNDPTNYYYPNIEWVSLMAKENGFKNVRVHYNDRHRATFILEK